MLSPEELAAQRRQHTDEQARSLARRKAHEDENQRLIRLRSEALRSTTGLNPAALSRLYIFLQRILFECVLGLRTVSGPRGASWGGYKRTLPRVDDSLLGVGDWAFLQRDSKFKSILESYMAAIKPCFYHNVGYPLGEGLAALAVNEEQKRITLHTHVVGWTTMSPEMVQSAAGHRYIEECLVKVMSSIFKTELPPHIMFKHQALHVISRLPKNRVERMSPPAAPSPITTPAVNMAAAEAQHKVIVEQFAEQCIAPLQTSTSTSLRAPATASSRTRTATASAASVSPALPTGAARSWSCSLAAKFQQAPTLPCSQPKTTSRIPRPWRARSSSPRG